MTRTSDAWRDTPTLNAFRTRLRGGLLSPGDPGYDAARRVWNGRVDKRPAFIVRCAEAADVIEAVRFARKERLRVAVRSGGHSVAGHGVCEGGLVIDVSPMKAVQVDAGGRTARAQAGVTSGEFLQATQSFGLAAPTCPRSDVGLSGLTLGGGLGWLTAKHGLTCDNLLSVDLVTAEGQLLHADATMHPDLFWAVRGGGGNFGVVTALEFRLHPVAALLAGMVIQPLARAADTLCFYRDYTRSCPDELTVDAAFVTAPDGRPVLGLMPCYCGAFAEGERLLAPLRAFGPPLADLVRPMAVTEAHGLSDPFSPAGRKYLFKAYGLPSLSDEAIEVIIRYAATRPSTLSVVVLRHFHGAVTRVPREATANPMRDEQYLLEIIAQWTEGEAKPHTGWAHAFGVAIEPFATECLFANALGEEDVGRVRASYGANYERLVRTKDRYDPTNFFRVNQNIPPVGDVRGLG